MLRRNSRSRQDIKDLTHTHTVFVLDSQCRSMAPCRPARARALLTAGKARVYSLESPFVIQLLYRPEESHGDS